MPKKQEQLFQVPDGSFTLLVETADLNGIDVPVELRLRAEIERLRLAEGQARPKSRLKKAGSRVLRYFSDSVG